MNYPKWQENGKLKLMIIVGTRPEIIPTLLRCCREYLEERPLLKSLLPEDL